MANWQVYDITHQDDPERPERVERSRHEYPIWGGQTLGWAPCLFALPVEALPGG